MEDQDNTSSTKSYYVIGAIISAISIFIATMWIEVLKSGMNILPYDKNSVTFTVVVALVATLIGVVAIERMVQSDGYQNGRKVVEQYKFKRS